MKKIFFCLTVLFLFPFTGTAEDLMKLIGKNFEIFSEDRPRFIKPSNARFFHWTSDEKNAARYPAYSNVRETLTLFGRPVAEVIVNFEENRVSNVYISVYNRGDNQPVSAAAFHKQMQELYNHRDIEK